jgi:hypothetical protein
MQFTYKEKLFPEIFSPKEGKLAIKLRAKTPALSEM